MEEIEVPTEQVQEDIHHHAHASGERWVLGVALSSAIIAGLAAVCAMLGGHHANEMVIDRVEATNKWAYYQSKGIEKTILEIEVANLGLRDKTLPEVATATERYTKKIAEYDAKRDESRKEAEARTHAADLHAARHHVLAYGVTMFQIAIAIGAISVLTKRMPFWYVSLGFALFGAYFLLQGTLFGVAGHG